MNRQRFFQRPDGQHINEAVAYVMFDLTGEFVEAFQVSAKDHKRPGCAWSLRQALQLVESGHWVEITDRMAQDKPHSPAAIEGGAW